VVLVDFGDGRPVQGELSERVTMDEFKRRLSAPIDYVPTNQRPNWQAVVAEHTIFFSGLSKLDGEPATRPTHSRLAHFVAAGGGV
jgi:hypothetical protein